MSWNVSWRGWATPFLWHLPSYREMYREKHEVSIFFWETGRCTMDMETLPCAFKWGKSGCTRNPANRLPCPVLLCGALGALCFFGIWTSWAFQGFKKLAFLFCNGNALDFSDSVWLLFAHFFPICFINVGVSENRDTPKWMVYNGHHY